MASARAPFKWLGGKGRMLAKLRPLVPDHRTYLEPYCGSAALLFAKTPAEVETVNDLHEGITNLFRVLRDESEEFMRLARLTEYSRALWVECRDTWQDEVDPVRRAWKWWYVASTSFSGWWGSAWGNVVTHSSRGSASVCAAFRTRIEVVLPECIRRLQGVQIENVDALRAIERYCTEDGFCYVDPPYVGDERAVESYDSRDPAGHDMRSTEEHAALVARLLDTPGCVLLSGYDHEVYDPLRAAGWGCISWQTSCYAAARTRASGIQGPGSSSSMQPRTETVWLNPKLQEWTEQRAEMLFEGMDV